MTTTEKQKINAHKTIIFSHKETNRFAPQISHNRNCKSTGRTKNRLQDLRFCYLHTEYRKIKISNTLKNVIVISANDIAVLIASRDFDTSTSTLLL